MDDKVIQKLAGEMLSPQGLSVLVGAFTAMACQLHGRPMVVSEEDLERLPMLFFPMIPTQEALDKGFSLVRKFEEGRGGEDAKLCIQRAESEGHFMDVILLPISAIEPTDASKKFNAQFFCKAARCFVPGRAYAVVGMGEGTTLTAMMGEDKERIEDLESNVCRVLALAEFTVED